MFVERWAHDVADHASGPYRLSAHQIGALKTPARANARTRGSLIAKGLLAFYVWRGPRGGRHVVYYLTDSGLAELRRINAYLDANGY